MVPIGRCVCLGLQDAGRLILPFDRGPGVPDFRSLRINCRAGDPTVVAIRNPSPRVCASCVLGFPVLRSAGVPVARLILSIFSSLMVSGPGSSACGHV